MTTEKKVIRPSSLPTLATCPHQWYKEHIEEADEPTYNSIAAVGSAIHKQAEIYWATCILAKQKLPVSIDQQIYAATKEFERIEAEENMKWNADHSISDVNRQIKTGVETYCSEAIPQMEIPLAVELQLRMEVEHPTISAIQGTIDCLYPTHIVDIKTRSGTRKKSASEFWMQQSAYVMLAKENGYSADSCFIHQIMLEKGILHNDEVNLNIPAVKYMINHVLERLRMVEDGVPAEMLFPGNAGPRNFLCSNKWCDQFKKGCRFVAG